MGALTFVYVVFIHFSLKLIVACKLCVICVRQINDYEVYNYDYTVYMELDVWKGS